MATELGQAYIQLMPSAKGIGKNIEKELNNETGGAGTKAGKSLGGSLVSSMKTMLVAAGVGKMITAALSAGGELQQNLGGTEAVFGDFAKKIQKTAGDAYKNMGLSASDYMATANKMGSLFQGSGMGAAVIYCHHHSKGAQGGKKAIDRASGSGVFARDPDAILDLSELIISNTVRIQEENDITCRISKEMIKEFNNTYYKQFLNQFDQASAAVMSQHIDKALSRDEIQEWTNHIQEEIKKSKRKTAWRIEGTLREFPSFESVDMWFDYPIHVLDQEGKLKEFKPESQLKPNERASQGRKTEAARKNESKRQLEVAFEACDMEGTGEIHISNIAEYLDTTEKTVRRRINQHELFEVENGIIKKISNKK